MKLVRRIPIVIVGMILALFCIIALLLWILKVDITVRVKDGQLKEARWEVADTSRPYELVQGWTSAARFMMQGLTE